MDWRQDQGVPILLRAFPRAVLMTSLHLKVVAFRLPANFARTVTVHSRDRPYHVVQPEGMRVMQATISFAGIWTSWARRWRDLHSLGR